jgi:uncharacterized protein (DUF1697 family)
MSMTTYVCLLRAVNVGGNRKLPMADLRSLLASLGLADPATYLQSGNAVFRSDQDPTGLSVAIESAIEDTFGFASAVLLLSGAILAEVVAANPYVQGVETDISLLYATFLREIAAPAKETALLAATRHVGLGTDEFSLGDGVVYLRLPGGYGRTKLSNAFFERSLGVTATTRNWRTVLALAELATAP